LRLSLYPFKGLLKTFNEKEVVLPGKIKRSINMINPNLVKIQAKEGNENENQTKD